MKAKRIIATIMSMAIAVTATSLLSACGGKDKGNNKPKTDTNIYYAVGNDKKSPQLKQSNWGVQNIIPDLTFKRDETVTDESVFKVTFDVYAGGSGGLSFKFVYKTSEDEVISDNSLYARAIDIDNFVGVEGEGTEAVVKNDKDEVVFSTGTGLDEGNIVLSKGYDGKYEFTLKTFPNDTSKQPELSYRLVEKIEVPYDMWLEGDVNNFWMGNTAEKYPMNELTTSWTASLEITADDLKRTATGAFPAEATEETEAEVATHVAVRVYNKVDDKGYVIAVPEEGEPAYPIVKLAIGDKNKYYPVAEGQEGDDYILLPVGSYTIVFNNEDKAVTVEMGMNKLYFKGTGLGMSWDECLENDYAKLTPSADKTVWTNKVYVAPDMLLNEKGEAQAIEFKLFDSLKNEWIGKPDGSNFVIDEAGLYLVTCTVSGDDWNQYEVTVEKFEFYLVGTMTDALGGSFTLVADKSPKLDTATYSITFEVTDMSADYTWMGEGNICALKCKFGVLDEEGNVTFEDWADIDDSRSQLPEGVHVDGNIMFSHAGTYKITVTIAHGEWEGNPWTSWVYTVEEVVA